MKSDDIIYGSVAIVSIGHVLLFVNPLWGAFVYVGALFVMFGGVLSCLK